METRALIEENEKLREENCFLREQLSDAQSHIFSLQPYLKDTTPEEVGREYDDLVHRVQEWVENLMGPLLDNVTKGAEEVMSRARCRPAAAADFRKTLRLYPDLVNASRVPETDEDIIAGVILRYLHDNIFQKMLYGSLQDYTEFINTLENIMQTEIQPKRDLFSVRTWTAETYNAVFHGPRFGPVRESCRNDMTLELASALRVFCERRRFQWLYDSIETNCIEPAMKLYEKIQVSAHHFYLEANPLMARGRNSRFTASPEFISVLDQLDCRNLLRNRKAFCLAKLDPQPSTQDLQLNLLNVCIVAPALFVRRVGQRDVFKEPVVVRKQQMLVLWGPEEKLQEFADSGDRTIVSRLCFRR